MRMTASNFARKASLRNLQAVNLASPTMNSNLVSGVVFGEYTQVRRIVGSSL